MGSNLHIGNLSTSVTVADLLELFGKISSVETTRIMTADHPSVEREEMIAGDSGSL